MDDIADFVQDMRLAGFSTTTLDVYATRLRSMPTDARTDVRKAKTWLTKKVDGGLSQASVAGYVKALKSYSRWRADEYAEDDVMAALKFPKLPQAKPGRIASDDDVKRVIGALKAFHAHPDNIRDRAILVTLAETGARRSEVMAMRLEDIDFETGTLLFPRTKGQRSRSVPMTPSLVRDLRRWLRRREQHPMADSDFVWLGSRGPLKPASLTKIFRRISDFAGLEEPIRPHELRRRLASRWVKAGGADDALMEIAGWNTPAMVARYRAAHREEIAAEQFRRIMIPEAPEPTVRRGPSPKLPKRR